MDEGYGGCVTGWGEGVLVGSGDGRGERENGGDKPAGDDDKFGVFSHGDWVGGFPVSC